MRNPTQMPLWTQISIQPSDTSGQCVHNPPAVLDKTLGWAMKHGNERVWLNRLGGTVSKPMATKLAATLTVRQNAWWGLYPVILKSNRWVNEFSLHNKPANNPSTLFSSSADYLSSSFLLQRWMSFQHLPRDEMKVHSILLFLCSRCDFCTPSRLCTFLSSCLFLVSSSRTSLPQKGEKGKRLRKTTECFAGVADTDTHSQRKWGGEREKDLSGETIQRDFCPSFKAALHLY